VKRAAILMLSLGLLFVAASFNFEAQTSTPTVNDILAKYVAAIGGRAAISKMTTRVSKGTLQIIGVQEWGTAESYAKAPNKYCSIITIPGGGEIRRGFDGHTAWLQSPDIGIAELSGQELASTQRSADLYQSVELEKLYPKLTLKGKETVAAYPAYVLEAVPGDGSIRRMYFDVASGLMVRSDEELDTMQAGRVSTQTFLEDYREVEGIKQPFSVRQIKGPITFVIHLTEVHINQPVDDAIFAKPAK
jgi:zinc protease